MEPSAAGGTNRTFDFALTDFSEQRRALGAFIRSQRELTNLSLRQVSALAGVSNPYLSQVERGLHEPSVRVLRSIAEALNLSADVLLEQAGMARHEQPEERDTEEVIRRDKRLSDQQKQALLAVYRSYCQANANQAGSGTGGSSSDGSKIHRRRPGAPSSDAARSTGSPPTRPPGGPAAGDINN